jgi:hypothetical protein
LTGGLAVAEQPFASPLRFRKFTTQDGLANRHLHCIVEGLDHRFYVGSDKGIDELDSATGRVRHFGMLDGLPSEDGPGRARNRKPVPSFDRKAVGGPARPGVDRSRK